MVLKGGKQYMKKLGEQLKKLRLSKHMTQDELAAAVGTTKASISNYERGQRNPPVSILNSIAAALDIQSSDLVSYMLEEEKNDEYTPIIPITPMVNSETPILYTKLMAVFNKLSDEGRQTAIKRLEELSMLPMYQRTLVNVLCEYISKRYHLTYELLEDTGPQKISCDDILPKQCIMTWNARHITLQREISPKQKKHWNFFYYSFNETIADNFDIMRILNNPVVQYEPGYNLGFVFDDESIFYKFYNRYVEHKGLQYADGEAQGYNTQALFLLIEKYDWEIKDVMEYDPNI